MFVVPPLGGEAERIVDRDGSNGAGWPPKGGTTNLIIKEWFIK